MGQISMPVVVAVAVAIAVPLTTVLAPALVVATDVQLPGTQPLGVSTLPLPSQCDNCHSGFDPISEPDRPWRGSMMAHAGRDPVFWATMAIAEQDFPGSGNFCLRCHTPRGWLEGRVDAASNGSQLTAADANGVECGICHQLTNPDRSEHIGQQVAPYLAHDGGTPPTGFYGSGMMVLLGGNTRLGPYAQANAAPHAYAQSHFHRDSALCGTCHDVSNPVVGDLAHNHGSLDPLPAGSFSGVPGSPVTTKAAFLNQPYSYGVVERTFSEHQSSAFANLRVRDYDTLPDELKRGILAKARGQALLAGTQGDHADGAPRLFSCQTCHMLPVVGKGAKQAQAPVRTDLGTHDLTGGNTWVPDLIQWFDQNGLLRLGGGLSTLERQALDAGKLRARAMLKLAAALDIDGDNLRVVNLTGHKLFTGYPEGRRMWLRTTWLDRFGGLVRVDGAYGPLAVNVQGTPHVVETLLDPGDPNLRLYEAKLGITQQWASQLLGLGVPGSLPLGYDRTTGTVQGTLGALAAAPPGTTVSTFHFVLNNTVVQDNRIPPYGMRYDDARPRNAVPTPIGQYGAPGPGGTYAHWDTVALAPPPGAVRAEFELLYQASSWEYIQFLLLANTQQDPFLAMTGQNLFNGWRQTGMSAPERMATASWCRLPGTGDDLYLRSGRAGEPLDANCAKTIAGGQTLRLEIGSSGGTFVGGLAAFALQVFPPSGPWPTELLPGVQLDRADILVAVAALPAAGATLDIPVPAAVSDLMVRAQGLVVSELTLSGFLGTSPAHDFFVP